MKSINACFLILIFALNNWSCKKTVNLESQQTAKSTPETMPNSPTKMYETVNSGLTPFKENAPQDKVICEIKAGGKVVSTETCESGQICGISKSNGNTYCCTHGPANPDCLKQENLAETPPEAPAEKSDPEAGKPPIAEVQPVTPETKPKTPCVIEQTVIDGETWCGISSVKLGYKGNCNSQVCSDLEKAPSVLAACSETKKSKECGQCIKPSVIIVTNTVTCQYCRVLEKAMEAKKITFHKITPEYKTTDPSVSSLPTILYFCDGKEVHRVNGYDPAAIQAANDKYLQ